MGSIIVEGLAVSAAAKVVGHGFTESYSHIRGKVASSKDLDENYKLLRQDVRSLVAIKEDNEKKVWRHKQKEITSNYSVWINKVSETVAEVEKLILKYESKKLPRWRFQRRSRLSEEMAKKLRKVWELSEEGQFPTGFLVNKLAEPVLKVLDAPPIKGFPTLQGSLEKILVLLKNNNIKTIGVYGMVGVGKTTILQNLNNNEEVVKLFDMVIFLRVSREQSEDKLQEAIANRLMLDTEGFNDHDVVARMIHTELENKNKVILATKYFHICKLSNVDRMIKVNQLSLGEAWMMFKNIVVDVIDRPDIKPIARLVSTRCARLPLLIKVIASSFKVKYTASSWRAGLEDLKPWPKLEDQGLKEMYSFLKFCYDELKDEKQQKCFLYSSLYPADSTIYTDYLVECWASEGFLGSINDIRRYQKARDKGYAVLEHLTNVSLLEKEERMIYVKMNNCIRQLALHISSEDPDCNFYVKTNEESEESTNLVTWQHANRASMIDSEVCDLPEKQNCNMLLTLLLQKNSKLASIPQTFFESMSSLLVLDLYGTKIHKLPSSLSNLKSLKGLYLNDCMLLKELPPEIESLQNLEVLDIRGCKVKFISFHIRCLINLRCLRISYLKSSEDGQSQDMDTDCDVIARLQKLEELIIEVDSYDRWCNEVEEVIKQVASLENLRSLRLSFPNPFWLKYFMEKCKSWREHKLASFRFFVGCQNSKRPHILGCFEYKINRYMKYCNGKLKDNCIIGEVLAETDAFELICHKSISKLSDFVGAASLERIRGWLIESCNKMSTIVDANFIQQSNNVLLDNMMDIDDEVDESDTSMGSILPKLEQLYLRSLLNLKCIFEGPMHPRRLQKLTVQDCSGIQELITEPEGTETEFHVLSKLETLVLINVPKLRTVCLNNSLTWPSLEVLKVHGCPELRSLPFSKDNSTNLRFIRGEQEWWNQLTWPTNEDEKWLQSIFAASGIHTMHVKENAREIHATICEMIQETPEGTSSLKKIYKSSTRQNTEGKSLEEDTDLLSVAARVKRIKV
ncbi:Disease resistance protein [Quillaja saponaria]|uniref:Disease resistance protein n=1 Tax=Quillaja saponaria TaxID=32244 RepID=A0AAD7M0Z7_QUISA|nr:Disease resistance protein [Quillaja saponaria]